jgi:lipopolysaccharide export system protein LptA
MNLKTNIRALLIVPLLGLAGGGLALEEDRRQPIQIESDRAERDEKAGTTIYMGNVELVQGSLKMLADRLEIYTLKGNQLERVVAYGKPAYVEQKPEPDKAVVKARGEIIRYFVAEERIQLEKNASIDQEGAMVNSNIIDYFIRDEIVKASGSEERVKVVIPPRDESAKP